MNSHSTFHFTFITHLALKAPLNNSKSSTQLATSPVETENKTLVYLWLTIPSKLNRHNMFWKTLVYRLTSFPLQANTSQTSVWTKHKKTKQIFTLYKNLSKTSNKSTLKFLKPQYVITNNNCNARLSFLQLFIPENLVPLMCYEVMHYCPTLIIIVSSRR